jgi:mannose-6-phosphate isomerase-like protein (cupin superfamily)
VFEETAASTRGEVVIATIRFRPTGPVAAEHLHPQQSERHELRSGELRLAFGGVERGLIAGEPVDVAVGTRHRIWNVGGDFVELRTETRPALHTDEFLVALVRLRSRGWLGQWSPLRLAAIAGEFPRESHLAGINPRVQRALLGVLAPVGRRLYR